LTLTASRLIEPSKKAPAAEGMISLPPPPPPPPHPPPSPHPPWAVSHPPEDAERTSGYAILAGFLLALGLAILVVVLMTTRGSKSSEKPDAFGEEVSVHEVSMHYPLSWSPRRCICWRKKGDPYGSPIYTFMWGFLCLWLAMCAVYLILVGSISSIEVFRGARHAVAAGLVAFALVLCASWSVLFVQGSVSASQRTKAHEDAELHRKNVLDNRELQADTGIKDGEIDWAKVDPEEFANIRLEPYKKHWITAACVVLGLAYLLCAIAVGVLRPWTLPGEQHGTLIFLAPGYGLLTGWLLYAFSLNYGIAVASWSHPGDEMLHKPEATSSDDNVDKTYPDDYLPVWTTAVGGLIAWACVDPAQMVPTIVTLVFFVDCKRANNYALGVAFLFLLISSATLYAEREARR
jgi:hypothetical protein